MSLDSLRKTLSLLPTTGYTKPVKPLTLEVQPTALKSKTLPTKIAQSTPAVTNEPGTIENIKTGIKILNPLQPTTVRPLFAKAGQETKLPYGGPVIGITHDLVTAMIEAVPRAAAVLTVDMKTIRAKGQAQSVKLPFDISRIGIDTMGTPNEVLSTYEDSSRYFEKLEKESPNTPNKNLILSTLRPVSRALDVLITGDMLTSVAKQGLKVTQYSPELNKALQQYGLQNSKLTGEALAKEVVRKLNQKATKLIEAGDTAGLNQLGESTNTIITHMTGKGIPVLNRFGQTVQNLSRMGLQDSKQGLKLVNPMVGELAPETVSKALPGYVVEPGQAPAFGLSTRKVRRVGGEASQGDLFRSKSGGKDFELVDKKNVMPAKIRPDLDTFVVKDPEGYVVIEGTTGAQIGEAQRTIPDAIQSAKDEVTNMPKGELEKMISESPLSPRYEQVPEMTKTVEFSATKEVKTPTDSETAAIDYYTNKIVPEIQKGKAFVVNADNLKEYFGKDFNDANHPIYSKAAFQLYEKALKEHKGDAVILTGGGPGAGKTEILVNNIKNLGFDGIIYDSNLSNLEGAKKQIQLARDAGKEVIVYGVLPDLGSTRVHTILRENETGRGISDATFARGHTGFPKVIKELLKQKILNSDEVRLFDNRNVFTIQQATDKVMMGEFEKNPIALLEKVQYNENNVREQFSKEKYNTKTGRRLSDARVREESRVSSTQDRTNKGTTDGRKDTGSVEKVSPEKKVERQIKREENKEFDSPAVIERKAQAFLEKRKSLDAMSEQEKLEYKRLQIEFEKDAIDSNPAKQLSKYAPKVGESAGSLPEVLGIGPGVWRERGDEIAADLGFESTEVAREEFNKYIKQRQNLAEMIEQVQKNSKDYQNQKKILDALKKQIEAEGLTRQKKIAGVRDFFKFSQNEWNRILKRTDFQDPRLYTDKQFEEFIGKLQTEGEATFRAVQRRVQLKSLIFQKEFKKTENLIAAMDFPSIENMTEKQIKELSDILENFKLGDEFLTKRQIETVKNTDIKDIRTVREALDNLAKEAGVDPKELNGISYKEMDNYRYDTALAEKNPFYKVMVNEKNRAFLEAGERQIKIKDNLTKYVGAARKSTKRTLMDRLIPTDKSIFKWLESDALGKQIIAEDMTAKELEAAHYIENLYSEARDYLTQQEVLKKYRSDYITHVRRGFLETWKDDGLLNAFKETFDQYKQDEQYFNILDGDTGRILPLEKFFQFSMRRSGQLQPTKNVAKAVETYFITFERKVALDSLVPKIDIYAHALSPRVYSERGLELDRSLKTFVRRWLNTKKGRVAETLIKPGGKVDWGLRSMIGLTRMLDLGFNIAGQAVAPIGEQVTNFTMLGARQMAKGTLRMRTKQGKKILNQAENFVGESIKQKLSQPSEGIGDKFMTGMFAIYSEASRIANAQFLLGSLTKEEFRSGEISSKRLAELKTEMGRYRVVDDATSVMGATSPGKIFTQYKKWAIPIVRTSAVNLAKVAKTIKEKGLKEAVKSKETRELFRTSLLAATIALTMGGYANSLKDKKDKNMAEEFLYKAYRDSMSVIGALDPTLFGSQARVLGFIEDLSQSLTDIDKLEKTLTPKAVKQFIPKKEETKTPTPTGRSDGARKRTRRTRDTTARKRTRRTP